MKIQIRKGVFETNSSSTHAIVIKNDSTINTYPEKVEFKLGEFGWEYDNYNDVETKASYLWTAIVGLAKEGANIDGYDNNNYTVNDFVKYITDTLAEYNITAEFPHNYKKLKSYTWLNGNKESFYNIFTDKEGNEIDYYIDHIRDLDSFLNIILTNKNLLMSYLFDTNSFIVTGNDNDDYDVEENLEQYDDTKYYKCYKGN